jgi:hypothetical protein
MPAPLRVLAASSKTGLLPRDYVLVLGDSYAEGHGDWLTAALRAPGRPSYQATHVLHELSGRDVVSLGSGGADNVSSMVFMVPKRFTELWRLGLGEPRDVLVYFYEGNDLNEDLHLARKRFGLGARALDDVSDAELDEALAARASAGFRNGLAGTLFAPYLLLDVLGGHSAGGLSGAEKRQLQHWSERPEPLPEENVFAVAGHYYRFDPIAQGPALELTEEELSFSLRLLARALAWTHARFPAAHLRLVYVPSPASCYEFLSPRVRVQTYEGREAVYPATLPWQRTLELRRRVAALAEVLALEVVDPSDELRALAREELLHGPNDAKHFNRAGYSAFGASLARALASEPDAARRE